MELPIDKAGPGRALHVAYVGPVDFPSSSAPAQRMMGVIQALNAAGDRVSVGSAGYQKSDAVMPADVRVDVSALGELPDPTWTKRRRVFRGLMWGAATRKWIQQLDPAPDVILVYGAALGYLARLIPLARRRSIPLVIDATEWYEPSHLPGGKWGPFALANSLSMRKVARMADGIIAISSFLDRYFAERGVATIRVPPLFALQDNPRTDLGEPPLSLCYVGSPGLKDRRTLQNLVRLPGVLGTGPDQLRIDIVGVDAAAAKVLLGDNDTAAIQHVCVTFHGLVTSCDARRVVAASSFSVLQRGGDRYARAGYPSKVPESLLLGTPVMANLTSDLSEVLVDGENSVILADDSLASLSLKVSESLRKPETFDRAKIAADARAVSSPVQYAQIIHHFLADLQSRR